jgi:hypothetical protein
VKSLSLIACDVCFLHYQCNLAIIKIDSFIDSNLAPAEFVVVSQIGFSKVNLIVADFFNEIFF